MGRKRRISTCSEVCYTRACSPRAQPVERAREKNATDCAGTGAGTGTHEFEAASGLWNEIQAGSYIFMDTDYARIGGKNSDRFADFEHSLFVLATVMSVPTAGRAIVDAGRSYPPGSESL